MSQMDEQKRAKLLSMSFVLENLGTTPLDLALRLTIEQAVMFYASSEFDRLHAMSISTLTVEGRGGNA